MNRLKALFLTVGAMASLSGAAMAQQASLVLLNGRVWTENPAQPEAEAVAVAGDRIVAVGESARIRAMAAPGATVIDLHGRRVTPGFNDSHVHLLGGGEVLNSVQLIDAKSPEEFRRRIGDYAKTLPKGTWILGGNWDHQQWAKADLPTHQLIDDVTPDNPVFITRTEGHMSLVNALAMKLAGLDRTTKTPAGGEIGRDRDGNPTGIVKDAGQDLIAKVIPPTSDAELTRALRSALAEAARNGVTSIQNVPDEPSDVTFRLYQRFARQGELTARIYLGAPMSGWKTLGDPGVQKAFGGATLRIGLLKAFADGAIGSTTAWMDEPFVGKPGNYGLASADLQQRDTFAAQMTGADKAGLQLAIHAIGTRANHEILDLFEQVEKANGPADRRFRIEHAQHINPGDIARFAKLGVIASMQPYHAIDDGRWVDGVIGETRSRTSYAWKSLLDSGAVLAFGSDWPVAPLDPLMGIYAAVTRATLDDKRPGGWVPEQRITVAQAVHAYTVGSAFAEFQETEKGSIAPGKLADMVVLTQDIFTIPPAQLAGVRVETTIFGGRVVYQRK